MALSLTLTVTIITMSQPADILLKSKTTSWVTVTFVTDKPLFVEKDTLQVNIVKPSKVQLVSVDNTIHDLTKSKILAWYSLIESENCALAIC